MKVIFRCRPRSVDYGMTLVEVLISLMLLVAFMGVYVAVTESVNRFFTESEAAVSGSQGLLSDRYALAQLMDRVADILSQPAFDRSFVEGIADDPVKNCTYDPVLAWGLPGEKLVLPNGYVMCLRKTSLVESSYSDLMKGGGSARPGVYVIQALPDKDAYAPNGSQAAAQPARRIFCRPKPFCDFLEK